MLAAAELREQLPYGRANAGAQAAGTRLQSLDELLAAGQQSAGQLVGLLRDWPQLIVGQRLRLAEQLLEERLLVRVNKRAGRSLAAGLLLASPGNVSAFISSMLEKLSPSESVASIATRAPTTSCFMPAFFEARPYELYPPFPSVWTWHVMQLPKEVPFSVPLVPY